MCKTLYFSVKNKLPLQVTSVYQVSSECSVQLDSVSPATPSEAVSSSCAVVLMLRINVLILLILFIMLVHARYFVNRALSVRFAYPVPPDLLAHPDSPS